MSAKLDKLKPRLLECIGRLQRLVELDAPAVIIGAAAWNVFSTTLAAYGSLAASTMVQHIRDENLHSRAVCNHEDCTNYVQRPDVGMCADCQKAMGLEDHEVFEAGVTVEESEAAK